MSKARHYKKNFLWMKFYGPILWMEFNYLKAAVPLRGDSLLFTATSPGVPGNHMVDLGRMKG